MIRCRHCSGQGRVSHTTSGGPGQHSQTTYSTCSHCNGIKNFISKNKPTLIDYNLGERWMWVRLLSDFYHQCPTHTGLRDRIQIESFWQEKNMYYWIGRGSVNCVECNGIGKKSCHICLGAISIVWFLQVNIDL